MAQQIEVIDNRNISAVYHAGDLGALIKRASIIRQSMNLMAKRNNHMIARTFHEYRVDPSDDDYNEQCSSKVKELQAMYKRMLNRGIVYTSAVIIIHNYAIEMLVVDQ